MGDRPADAVKDGAGLLQAFELLPKVLVGQQVEILFRNPVWHTAGARNCRALGLETGATIYGRTRVEPGGNVFALYATGPLAQPLGELRVGEGVRARAMCRFGLCREVHPAPEQPVVEEWTVTGLLITDLLGGKGVNETNPFGRQRAARGGEPAKGERDASTQGE